MSSLTDDYLTAFLDANLDPQQTEKWVASGEESLQAFLAAAVSDGKRVALVTSGGTTVPLERNTVRFVSNFSTGGRGSKMAECLLASGWRVIFLHRRSSLLPYHRCLQAHAAPLDAVIDGRLEAVVHDYRVARAFLHTVDFDTVTEYLFRLRYLSRLTERFCPNFSASPLIVLAAAVSDYFVPRSAMSEHKISGALTDGTMTVTFHQVPKVLGLLRHDWAPSSKVVSFKLETDPDALEKKALGNLTAYSNDAVVANLLQTYATNATVYFAAGDQCTVSSTGEGTAMEAELLHLLLARLYDGAK